MQFAYNQFISCHGTHSSINLNSSIECIILQRNEGLSCNTQVLKQGPNIKTMCPKYIIEFRNTKSLTLRVDLGARAKIENVIENHVC